MAGASQGRETRHVTATVPSHCRESNRRFCLFRRWGQRAVDVLHLPPSPPWPLAPVLIVICRRLRPPAMTLRAGRRVATAARAVTASRTSAVGGVNFDAPYSSSDGGGTTSPRNTAQRSAVGGNCGAVVAVVIAVAGPLTLCGSDVTSAAFGVKYGANRVAADAEVEPIDRVAVPPPPPPSASAAAAADRTRRTTASLTSRGTVAAAVAMERSRDRAPPGSDPATTADGVTARLSFNAKPTAAITLAAAISRRRRLTRAATRQERLNVRGCKQSSAEAG